MWCWRHTTQHELCHLYPSTVPLPLCPFLRSPQLYSFLQPQCTLPLYSSSIPVFCSFLPLTILPFFYLPLNIPQLSLVLTSFCDPSVSLCPPSILPFLPCIESDPCCPFFSPLVAPLRLPSMPSAMSLPSPALAAWTGQRAPLLNMSPFCCVTST